ncbi:MAG TPA: TerC family protein [Verrucomicrobiae bacterium]|nr:TerC family protein [Verrucomicrobiae bacterium]
MLGEIVTSGWDWSLFIIAVIFFLAVDLGVFHRKAHVVGFAEALGWSVLWCAFAITFGLFIAPEMAENWGRVERDEFITGYIIELSLSMDNVFVIALIFSYFSVPLKYQHRVLFWGILGALIMRGAMIGLGTALIKRFEFVLYVLGAFLVFTGLKMVISASGDDQIEPEKNIFIRLTRRFFPIVNDFEGAKFLVRRDRRWFLTPLALVLVMVETTDLIFAIDSIPAIFGVTTNPFIVFTSNVFAILGLRSLYFVLAGAIEFFRFLKVGLSIVLCFIGAKMLIAPWHHISTSLSLLIVGTIIITSILMSLVAAKKK